MGWGRKVEPPSVASEHPVNPEIMLSTACIGIVLAALFCMLSKSRSKSIQRVTYSSTRKANVSHTAVENAPATAATAAPEPALAEAKRVAEALAAPEATAHGEAQATAAKAAAEVKVAEEAKAAAVAKAAEEAKAAAEVKAAAGAKAAAAAAAKAEEAKATEEANAAAAAAAAAQAKAAEHEAKAAEHEAKSAAAAAETTAADQPAAARTAEDVGDGPLDVCAVAWSKAVATPDGLPCAAFLSASYATTAVFNLLGSVVSSVSKDIESNAKKLEKATKAVSGQGRTLEQLIADEMAAAGGSATKAAKEGSALLALLWLARYLRLVEVMLRAMVRSPDKSLRDCIYEGYRASLEPHHNFLTRKALSAAILASPSRQFFYSRLGTDADGCAASIRPLLQIYSPIMRQVHELVAGLGLEIPPTSAADD